MLYLTRVSIIKALYIDLTPKDPFWRRPHINLSCTSLSLMCATEATSLNHWLRLFPTNPLQKEMFSSTVLKTIEIETFLLRVIAYNEGYN
jgi:hypothetical protein